MTDAPVWPTLTRPSASPEATSVGGHANRRIGLAAQRLGRRLTHADYVPGVAEAQPGRRRAPARSTSPAQLVFRTDQRDGERQVPRGGERPLHDRPRPAIASHRVDGNPYHRVAGPLTDRTRSPRVRRTGPGTSETRLDGEPCRHDPAPATDPGATVEASSRRRRGPGGRDSTRNAGRRGAAASVRGTAGTSASEAGLSASWVRRFAVRVFECRRFGFGIVFPCSSHAERPGRGVGPRLSPRHATSVT